MRPVSTRKKVDPMTHDDDNGNPRAAYLSALRRNYTFDSARAAVAAASEKLNEARATLVLAHDLRADLGVLDVRVLSRAVETLSADLHALGEALADTVDVLATLNGRARPARATEYVAADGVTVIQIDADANAGPVRVNLNETRIHDGSPAAATPEEGNYWPTEAGLLAIHRHGRRNDG